MALDRERNEVVDLREGLRLKQEELDRHQQKQGPQPVSKEEVRMEGDRNREWDNQSVPTLHKQPQTTSSDVKVDQLAAEKGGPIRTI